MKSFVDGQIQSDFFFFCSLKALKSIQELTKLHCKRMIDGTGHVDSEENESIAQLSSNESALHVQKEISFEAFCCFEKNKKVIKRQKKKSNFAVRLVLRPMLSYLIVFKPWMVSCNAVLVYLCHNVVSTLLFFFCFF